MRPINWKVLLRKIHYWLSVVIMLPSGIIIIAGIVLMLKKDFDWIQPPTQRGEQAWVVPGISYEHMLITARGIEQSGIHSWEDIKRIDIRPNKGVAKMTSLTDWEIQFDTATGAVLSVAYRRSDWIEAIHDGSFFADPVKRYIFLPTGILLLIMWGTGIYLFFMPRILRARRRRAVASQSG
ncbi:MAG: PepSY domain-containing protein [Pseudomonadota bacterium]